MNKKIVALVLVVLFTGHLLFRIAEYKDRYTIPFDARYWKNRFELSQWGHKKGCSDLNPHVNPYTCEWDDNWYRLHGKNSKSENLKKTSIGDDGLYTYVAWEYMNGKDPSLLNAEIPPLGKYAVGVTIQVFHNQNIFGLLTGLLALGCFYWLNSILFKDKVIAGIPVVLFSFEPLFYEQLKAPYLDLFHLSLLFVYFIFLIKKRYIVALLALGCMASVKASSATFILGIATGILFLLIQDKKTALRETVQFIIRSPLALLPFLASYYRYFALGHTFRDFLGLQKYIVVFYANGAKGDPFSIWQILLTGNWSTWWGVTSKIAEWSILWPLLLISSIFSIIIFIKQHRTVYPFSYLIKKKTVKTKINKNKEKIMTMVDLDTITLIMVWVVFYVAFLMVVPVWSRYLLLLFPFMYNLAIWVILKSIPGKLRQV